MKRLSVLLFVVVLGVTMAGAAWGEDGRFLVMFESNTASSSESNASHSSVRASALKSEAIGILSRSGVSIVKTLPALSAASGKGFAIVESFGANEVTASSLASTPGVIAADPNFKVRASVLPDDLLFNQQLPWMSSIGAPDAWDTATGDASVVVAIFDTGIDITHPDLAGNIATDDDGNQGFNAFSPDALPIDGDGHGTHVSGIIGAVGNNAQGIAGVNWAVGLLPVKVLDDNGDGSTLNIIEGIEYVLDQISKDVNIRVANFSLSGWSTSGGAGYETALKSLASKNVVLVFAAGNEHQDISNPGGPGSNPDKPDEDYRGKKPYPAAFSFDTSLTIAAADVAMSAKADFSNYSDEYVHLMAPGTDITSTVVSDDYGAMSGTSMAAPFVSGAAALVASHFPDVSAKAIRSAIMKNVRKIDGLDDVVFSSGYLNLAEILLEEPEEEEVVIDSITIAPEELTLVRGAYAELTATVLPKSSTAKITWLSSNPNVATIEVDEEDDTKATVTGVEAGEAIITAKAGNKTASLTVVVRSGVIAILPSAISLFPGDTYQLRVSGVESDRVTWSSANPKIVTVNESGLVTAEGGGTGVILASPISGEGEAGSCTVTVETKEPEGENSGCSVGGIGGSPLTVIALGIPLYLILTR